MIRRVVCVAIFSAAFALDAHAQTPLPEWARARWDSLANARSLQLSLHATPQTLSGDFDGDGKPDVALLVEHRTTHKIGIVFLHRKGAVSRVIGAGRAFSNGGDNFDWMDSWKIEPRTKTRRTDAVIIERESSASARIY
ncbi:MAG: hypothetical protein ABI120_17210, partial [Gemmatimonadaceae bacterium]